MGGDDDDGVCNNVDDHVNWRPRLTPPTGFAAAADAAEQTLPLMIINFLECFYRSSIANNVWLHEFDIHECLIARGRSIATLLWV